MPSHRAWVTLVALTLSLTTFPAMASQLEVDDALGSLLGVDATEGISDAFFKTLSAAIDLPNFSFQSQIADFDDNYLRLSGDKFDVEIKALDIGRDEPDLFVNTRLFGAGDKHLYGSFPLILRWLDSSFRVLVTTDELFQHDLYVTRAVRIDNNKKGVAIHYISGATFWFGAFQFLIPSETELTYSTVLYLDVPGHYVFVNEETIPLSITYIELSDWDDDFPIRDLSGLSSATADSNERRFIVTVEWQGDEFVEVERYEEMHPFAIVNHHLRSMESAEIGSADLEWLFSPPPGYKVVPLPASGQKLVEKTGADIALIHDDDPLQIVVVGLIPENVLGDITVRETDVRALATFLVDTDSETVLRIEPYQVPEIPKGFRFSNQDYHARPYPVFDKIAIAQFASRHGWEEAYWLSQSIESVYDVGPWITVDAVRYTPMSTWVEVQYSAYLNFENPSDAERTYALVLRPRPFFQVLISSLNEEAIALENLRFVLTDDRGNRWEGFAEPIRLRTSTLLGIPVYHMGYWVYFEDAPSIDSIREWEEINQITLHVIPKNGLYRADLTWKFEPLTEDK